MKFDAPAPFEQLPIFHATSVPWHDHFGFRPCPTAHSQADAVCRCNKHNLCRQWGHKWKYWIAPTPVPVEPHFVQPHPAHQPLTNTLSTVWELILYPHQHWFNWTTFPWVPDILQPSGISLKVPGVCCLWSTQPLLPCRSKFSLHEQNVKLFCLLSLQNTENLFQSSHKFKRRKLLYNLPLSSFPYSLDFCVLSLYPFFSISQE